MAGETIEINAVVSYATSATFSWLEDFENASLSFLYHSDSDTVINKQSVDVKEGVYAGQVYLENSMDFFEATTVGLTGVPRNATPVFLELDLKTNEPVFVGIYTDSGQHSWFTLNTATTWRKCYVDLAGIINTAPQSSELKVFFGIKEESTLFLTNNPEIYLDNLKLVHF